MAARRDPVFADAYFSWASLSGCLASPGFAAGALGDGGHYKAFILSGLAGEPPTGRVRDWSADAQELVQIPGDVVARRVWLGQNNEVDYKSDRGHGVRTPCSHERQHRLLSGRRLWPAVPGQHLLDRKLVGDDGAASGSWVSRSALTTWATS